MIAQITGKVVSFGENAIFLEVGPMTYEIFVPSSVISFYKKKSSGDSLPETELEIFYTIQYIEGSSSHGNQFFRLVGFKRKIEKEFFQVYTRVEGIGYKTAIKSLIFPIQKIALAIEKNDLSTLKKLPHIGSRTAEKMVATLRGRMQKFALDPSDQPLTIEPVSDLETEVMQVLGQVGYSIQESRILIDKVFQKNPKIDSAEAMIQEIFRIKNMSAA